MSNNKTIITAEPGKQEIVITRTFDAPRDLVFKAYTDPKLIEEWWGPRRLTVEIDKMEVKPGGPWRFINKDADGNIFAFHGVYHDLKVPEWIVFTFEWEGMPGHVLMETIKLEEVDGQTKLTDISVFQTVEDRDGMLANGMEGGAEESTERMAELLEKMQK